MSSDPIAIQVEGLGKRYEIYETPRDRLKQFLSPVVGALRPSARRDYFREFWALRDLSFELKRGETLGIVGRNGSGKSTLLQIICGILRPSLGEVRTHGRIAALLELGSGFNPEFTGRENLIMNASLLGLTPSEIQDRYDDILAFADIGDFIDQPVKTYSSGMYVRLAFAVIAHVDADILVVDEALAVGDAVFTQRCMRFIRAFQGRGTLLFVSHDMAAVQNLCQSAIWLDKGRLVEFGPSQSVAENYLRETLQSVYGDEVTLASVESQASTPAADPAVPSEEPVVDYGARAVFSSQLDRASGWKTGSAEIVGVELERRDAPGDPGVLEGWEWLRLRIRARAHADLERPILGFILRDRLGQDLFGENTLPFTDAHPTRVRACRTFRAEFVFRLPMLPNGQYVLMASVADGDLYDNLQHHMMHDACVLTVSSSKVRWGLVGVPFSQLSLMTDDVR
ncbi:ABC transporter ATP-binding protein [Imhoffiella purpurea]|uniref:Teichoic acid export ATP-binding protein TagH n=1 Tax=Imhoffiella purpurea TaxID=1249627 RepID=W9V8Q9_9GAMM|nr:ABC transporter ATP-binding protein [Imhoffiella purpurea]EXJ15983.1 Teichoic acid export ATP-binding protein TagH [Imhoffiella purpurea]